MKTKAEIKRLFFVMALQFIVILYFTYKDYLAVVLIGGFILFIYALEPYLTGNSTFFENDPRYSKRESGIHDDLNPYHKEKIEQVFYRLRGNEIIREQKEKSEEMEIRMKIHQELYDLRRFKKSAQKALEEHDIKIQILMSKLYKSDSITPLKR